MRGGEFSQHPTGVAKERHEPIPALAASVRRRAAAVAPSLRKVVPLELVQRKFDEFFNNRSLTIVQAYGSTAQSLARAISPTIF